MKESREYKIEERPRWKGIGELKEKYCSKKKTVLAIYFKNYISVDWADDDFL